MKAHSWPISRAASRFARKARFLRASRISQPISTHELRPAFERIGFKVQIYRQSGGRRRADCCSPSVSKIPVCRPFFLMGMATSYADSPNNGVKACRRGNSKQEGGRYYGRGSADNKAQHSINMAALATVIAERGKLGFNAKFFIETGEEVGSPGLQQFCERESSTAQSRRADCVGRSALVGASPDDLPGLARRIQYGLHGRSA